MNAQDIHGRLGIPFPKKLTRQVRWVHDNISHWNGLQYTPSQRVQNLSTPPGQVVVLDALVRLVLTDELVNLYLYQNRQSMFRNLMHS